MKKVLRETQTLRTGCSKAEPKIFATPQTPFPGAQDGQNLISWRWSLSLPTDPVWWRSMYAISSYRGNRPTNTHTQTGLITIYWPLSLTCSAIKKLTKPTEDKSATTTHKQTFRFCLTVICFSSQHGLAWVHHQHPSKGPCCQWERWILSHHVKSSAYQQPCMHFYSLWKTQLPVLLCRCSGKIPQSHCKNPLSSSPL